MNLKVVYILLRVYQDLKDVPISKSGETNELLAWIAGSLGTVLIAIVIGYEVKLKNRESAHATSVREISQRLNTVIDQSMLRMERKNETKEAYITRMNDMISQLKEIIIVASNNFKRDE